MQDEGITIVTVRIPMGPYRQIQAESVKINKSINATIILMLLAQLEERS